MTFDHKDTILVGEYDRELNSAYQELPGKMDQPAIAWRSIKPIGDPPIWKKLLERIGFIKIERRRGLSVLFEGFVQAILDGGEPAVTGEIARQALELTNAIVLSAVRGKTVDLPMDRQEYDHLFRALCAGETQIPRIRCAKR